MESSGTIVVREFEPRDQSGARRLILEGLGGHFGFIDEAMNPDLDDIGASYAEGLFLVAECDGRIVGTGALVAAGGSASRIVRMSTSAACRRRGVASSVLDALIAHARGSGSPRLLVATQPEWENAVGLYAARGFVVSGRDEIDVQFSMDL